MRLSSPSPLLHGTAHIDLERLLRALVELIRLFDEGLIPAVVSE